MFVFVFWNKILKLLLGKRCLVKLCVCACLLEQNFVFALFFESKSCVCVCFFEQNFETSARQAMAYIVFLMSEARKVPLTLPQPKS